MLIIQWFLLTGGIDGCSPQQIASIAASLIPFLEHERC